MIISKLQGGLGNQLFQWAYAYDLSKMYNINFYLDKSSYFVDRKRSYELNKFPFIKQGINDYELMKYKDLNYQIINDNFYYKSLLLDSNTIYILDGYWQSEKYFKFSQKSIKNILRPEDDHEKLLASKIKPNSVSIHIRRTDYVTSNGYHPVQPIEYFEKALKLLDYDYIYVFSDDITWCMTHLPFKNIEYMCGYDNIDDLWLMSMCSHNIIANSSFSWWGAWLNDNINKKVIAPKNWFGPQANLNTNDIIPEDWIVI